jgi:hypothetical protein
MDDAGLDGSVVDSGVDVDAPNHHHAGSDASDAGDAAETGSPTVQSGPCAPLAAHATSPDGFASDEFAWADSQCHPRTAALVKNDSMDPAGYFGGYMRQYTYVLPDSGGTRTARGAASAPGNDVHPGWGYTVNHYGPGGGSDTSSRKFMGTARTVFALPFHAIHEFKCVEMIGAAPVTVTMQWFFAVGHDHPVWTITYDATAAGPDAVTADTRAPYGDLLWTGDAPFASDVSGLGWGDHYRFETVGPGPVQQTTGWDYTKKNAVPFVKEWATSPDAEMGAVQTVPYAVHEAGGPGLSNAWGTSQTSGPLPDPTTWPYQLNQYELPFGTTSKRLAWGMAFGAVGQTTAPTIDPQVTIPGYPFQSYSVLVVLGTHTSAPVDAVVAMMEQAAKAALTATVGEVVARGPAGIGRTDAVDYKPAGYNPIFGTWDVKPAAGRAHLTFDAGAGQTLLSPIVVLRGYGKTTLPRLTVGGRALTYGVDALPSYDASTGDLWVTFVGGFTSTVAVAFD